MFKKLTTTILGAYFICAPLSSIAVEPPPSFTEKCSYVRMPSGLELEVVTDLNLIGPEYCGQYNRQSRKKSISIPQECEFYDPNHSGNPLVRVRTEDLDKKISAHFTVGDFSLIQEKEVQFVLGEYTLTVDDQTYSQYIRIDPEIIQRVEELLERTKVTPKIKDWYRSFGYNARLYWSLGKKPSSSEHCSGDAVDIFIPFNKTMKTVKELFADGGIGFGRDFYHLDTRGTKARWYYHLMKRKKK